MSVRKFYTNKAKTGWKENPAYIPLDKIPKDEKQKEHERKFYSWGYDIDLEPNGYNKKGELKRNRLRESGFASRKAATDAAARQKFAEKDEKYSFKKTVYPRVAEVLQAGVNRLISKKEKRRALTIFNRWLGLLERNVRLDELKPEDLKLYVDDRKGKIADGSINRELTNIASALHKAHEDFSVLENWVCPRIPRLKVKRGRRERLISALEIDALFKHLFKARMDEETKEDYEKRRVVGQAFQMALLTGARIGEIAGMRWEHIDFGAKILQIHGKKSQYVSASVVRYLELTPTMEKILRNRQNIDTFGAFVFCRTGNTITYYHEILAEAAKSAGLAYGKGKKGAFVTHDARHTAVTKMLQGGIDLSTIGSITGHSDKTLILHYSHATRDSRRAAGSVLDDFARTSSSEF
jgi:integrase